MNHRLGAAPSALRHFSRVLGALLRVAFLALPMWLPVAHAGDGAASFTRLNGPPPPAADRRLHDALAAWRGQPVIINFWATWCPPCREEMPALSDLAEYRRADGLRVVTVLVADRRRRADEFLRPYGIELPLIDDPEQELSRAWGATVLPTSLLLDARHRLRWRVIGAVDWLAPETEKRIQSLF